jgi:hypothetical protein
MVASRAFGHRIRGSVRVLLTTLAAVAVVACSQTATQSPTAAPTTTGGPRASAAASPVLSGVLVSERWCLNSTDEVANAIGEKVSGLAGAEVPGLGGGCTYTAANGAIVLSQAIITGPAALGTFNGAKLAEGAIVLSGVGDEAVLVTARGPMVIRLGRIVISMTVTPTSELNDSAKLRTAFEQLGKAAVQRIPPE